MGHALHYVLGHFRQGRGHDEEAEDADDHGDHDDDDDDENDDDVDTWPLLSDVPFPPERRSRGGLEKCMFRFCDESLRKLVF